MKAGTQWVALVLVSLLKAVSAEHYLDESKQRSPLNVGDSDCVKRTGKGFCDALRCAPSTLAKGDTLVLSLSIPHGDNIVGIDPDGKWFDVNNASGQPFRTDEWEPLQNLSIATTASAGDHSGNAAIFTKPGRYRFLVGIGFQTDEHGIFGFCDIRFKAPKHP